MFILDNLENPGETTQGYKWKFFTDGVMGGMSSGKFHIENFKNKKCYRITGNVTTKNNGGFIQIRVAIKSPISAKNFLGIYIKVYGNSKKYAVHLRTPLTLAPWQYYGAQFIALNKWSQIKLPFIQFKKSNFYQPKYFNYQQIKSIGIVAGFYNFKADLAISEIGFY